jgi:hypothetical protein
LGVDAVRQSPGLGNAAGLIEVDDACRLPAHPREGRGRRNGWTAWATSSAWRWTGAHTKPSAWGRKRLGWRSSTCGRSRVSRRSRRSPTHRPPSRGWRAIKRRGHAGVYGDHERKSREPSQWVASHVGRSWPVYGCAVPLGFHDLCSIGRAYSSAIRFTP